MSYHVYARVSGFGWTLLPLAPFRFERDLHVRRSVVAIHHTADGSRRALLTFDEGAPVVRLDEGTTHLNEVLELLEGPNSDSWTIETTVFSIRWPDGFAVQSTLDPPGFDLHGPNGTLVFLQGPFDPSHLPTLSEMAGPGQTIQRMGASWIDLRYLHDGVLWLQTHRLVEYGTDVVVVSSQAPETWHALVSAAAAGVADSLSPMDPV